MKVINSVKEMEIIYRAATKSTKFGSKPVEPKKKLLPYKISLYLLRPIQTETHNPKRIYFALGQFYIN